MSSVDYSSLPPAADDPRACSIRSPAGAEWVPLPLAPQLESWMAKDHPDSQRLRAFVDDALLRISPYIEGGSCGLELDVRLAPSIPLTIGGRDIDNYLFPLISRLGERRASIVSAFGAKGVGEQSRVRAGSVRDDSPPTTGWRFAHTEAAGPAGSARWRDLVIANLLPMPEVVPPGPLEMHITFRGNRTNWHQDWKPTIDGLGAILGLEHNGGHADDSRITRLALHQMADSSLGSRTLIGVWWRAATRVASGS